jgi:hypothetical protein
VFTSVRKRVDQLAANRLFGQHFQPILQTKSINITDLVNTFDGFVDQSTSYPLFGQQNSSNPQTKHSF